MISLVFSISDSLSLIFALLAIFCSFTLIFTKNPIYAIFNLILVFFSVSILLFILHLEFLPIIFLIIYVGAVAVLFLFVVMMLNIKSLVFEDFKSLLPIGIFLILIIILYTFYFLARNTDLETSTDYLYLSTLNNDSIFKVYLLRIYNISDLTNIALVFYNNNFLIFMLAAFILLVAMIGAIVLTTKNHNYLNSFERYKKQKIANQILHSARLLVY